MKILNVIPSISKTRAHDLFYCYERNILSLREMKRILRNKNQIKV